MLLKIQRSDRDKLAWKMDSSSEEDGAVDSEQIKTEVPQKGQHIVFLGGKFTL